jgi:tetratricopeptide (TPR) repeat protein
VRTLVVLLAACLAITAGAEEQDRVNRARAHYEAGRALYTLGDYDHALREFVAGYQLSPRPEFLLNSGQALRRLERLDEAQAMFEKYLRETPTTDPNRAQVDELLTELQRHRAELPSPVVAAPAPREKPSFVRRNWWIFPVGAVVLAGAAVGIYFAVRPSVDCSATPLGCLDASNPAR